MQKWLPSGPADRASAVAVRAIRGRTAIVRRLLKAVTKSPNDPVGVHQLRVWCRRTEAALDFFAPLFPARRLIRLRKAIRGLRRAAGPARGLDVLAQIEARPSLKERRRAGKKLARAARRWRQGRLKRRVESLVARVADEAPPFAEFARARLGQVTAEFLAADPPADATESALHQFRIRGKGLRYSLELAAGVLPIQPREAAYKVLGELQERLGTINDLAVRRGVLDERADRATDPADLSALRRQSAEAHGMWLDSVAAFRGFWSVERMAELRSHLDACGA